MKFYIIAKREDGSETCLSVNAKGISHAEKKANSHLGDIGMGLHWSDNYKTLSMADGSPENVTDSFSNFKGKAESDFPLIKIKG